MLLVHLFGCARSSINQPHLTSQAVRGHRFSSLRVGVEKEVQEGEDRDFLILAFSGGGIRAAAFAYGAMQALRDSDAGDHRSMLDEVDVISAVSGGSFAAAYYGLFGRDEFFAQFPSDVLHRWIELDLILRLLAPWNWIRLLSPTFSRGDLAAEFYSDSIFRNRTYGSLPRRRPFILVNATDIGLGQQFVFTQDQFDDLCSEMDSLPVGYAVFASTAFPVAFTPLTLANYNRPGICRYPRYVDTAPPGAKRDAADSARMLHANENARERPFLHLADGGLTDNLGLQAIEDGHLLAEPGEFTRRRIGLADLIRRKRVKHLGLIAVDARPGVRSDIDENPTPPSVLSVLDAAVGVPMGSLSAGSVDQIRSQVERWRNGFYDQLRQCADLAAR